MRRCQHTQRAHWLSQEEKKGGGLFGTVKSLLGGGNGTEAQVRWLTRPVYSQPSGNLTCAQVLSIASLCLISARQHPAWDVV